MTELLLRAGEWEQVTPESAGWQHLYFGLREGLFAAETGDVEIALVPLSGHCRVEAEGESWELGGRENVFAGMPGALYLPRDTPYRVEADGEVAICGARCERRREPVLIRPEDVEVEVRGAGMPPARSTTSSSPSSRPSACSSSRCSLRPATGRATRRTSTTRTGHQARSY